MGEEGDRRSCGTPRELQQLKQQAMKYYRENDVPRRLEELLNSTFYLQPADVYGHLANCFSKLAKPPTICKVVGKSVLDGLALPTLQVEIFCTIQNFTKNICSVVISTHFDVHENTLPEVAEMEEAESSQAVSEAVQWVNGALSEQLQGISPSNQAEVDQVLRTFFENKVQEEQERREMEKSLEDSMVLVSQTPPPPPPPPAKKKGQKAGGISLPQTKDRPFQVLSILHVTSLTVATTSGKQGFTPSHPPTSSGTKDAQVEKPIPPAEPPEPVLCGSMAIGAISLAAAKAGATLDEKPLYLNIAVLKCPQEQPPKLTMPLAMVSMVSCGKSSAGKLNLMKELMCIPHPGLSTKQGVEMLLEIQKQINKTIETPPPPKVEMKKGHNGGKRGPQQITGKMSHLGCLTINYDTIEQPLLLLQGICANLGLELGTNLHLAINCAAHELMDYSKGKYEVMTGTYKSATEMVELYTDLLSKFPSIIALIDPFRKEDAEQWDSLYTTLGARCHIIAGAASRSICKLLEDGNISTPRSSGLILRHTNQTTMSDLVKISHLMDSKRRIAIFGSTERESSDDSLVDLATGLGIRFIKLGGLSRGERVTKYNRLLTIEEELVQNKTLGFNEEHTFFYLDEEAEKDAMTGMASELLEPLEPIFPTEVGEELVQA